MASATTFTDQAPDPLNMHTYTWAEWSILTISLLLFGCYCICVGICYHKWMIRNEILTENDINDIEEPEVSPFKKKRKKFKSNILSPSSKNKHPMSFNDAQIQQHINESMVANHSVLKEHNDGKLKYQTLNRNLEMSTTTTETAAQLVGQSMVADTTLNENH
eukprot:542579_1